MRRHIIVVMRELLSKSAPRLKMISHLVLAFKPRFLRATGLCCCLRLLSGVALSPLKQNPSSDTLPRLYVGPSIDDENFMAFSLATKPTAPKMALGSTILISKEQSHYLSTVLRSKNKRVRLFNGTEEWVADIVQEGMDAAIAIPKERLRANEDSIRRKSIWLCFPALKKRDRMKWLIEKTTELGCTGYVFLDSDYSERTNLHTNKLFAYAIEASEQCERTDLPRFVSTDRPIKVLSFLETMAQGTVSRSISILICRERLDTHPLLQVLQETETRNHEHVFLLVGPEGGWSQDEQKAIDNLQRKYPEIVANVSLGRRILRTETSAVAAIATYNLLQDVYRSHDK